MDTLPTWAIVLMCVVIATLAAIVVGVAIRARLKTNAERAATFTAKTLSGVSIHLGAFDKAKDETGVDLPAIAQIENYIEQLTRAFLQASTRVACVDGLHVFFLAGLRCSLVKDSAGVPRVVRNETDGGNFGFFDIAEAARQKRNSPWFFGQRSGNDIKVAWTGNLETCTLGHELTHALLERAFGNSDPQHTLAIWTQLRLGK